MKHSAILIFLFIYFNSFGQYNTNQNANWTFGYYSGVDFNSGSPVNYSTGNSSREGTATVSDKSSNLLFYTNGQRVYNKLHSITPLGNSIVPFSTQSTSQGALIVPKVGNSSQYYIFSGEPAEPGFSGKIMYSIFDIMLDGGLGDIVPGSAATPLTDSASEKMIAIPGTDCDLWIVTHKKTSNIFQTYRITDAGISGPVNSSTGMATPPLDYKVGVMKASHDYKKIALISLNGPTELYDFDAATGIVSGCEVLDSAAHLGYGLEFSPDGSKLYVSQRDDPSVDYRISQFDLTAGSLAEIVSSKSAIGYCYYYSDLRLAPDGEIYFMSDSVSATGTCVLGRIDAPNNAGVACGYNHGCLALSTVSCGLGLPNVFVMLDSGRIYSGNIAGADTLCLDSTYIMSSTTTGGTWSSGGIKTNVDASGVVTALETGIDTIKYTSGDCGFTASHIVTVQHCGDDLSFLSQHKERLKISLTPNPSNGNFNYRAITNKTTGVITIHISDLMGRPIETMLIKANVTAEIKLPNSGMYILRSCDGKTTKISKAIVE